MVAQESVLKKAANRVPLMNCLYHLDLAGEDDVMDDSGTFDFFHVSGTGSSKDFKFYLLKDELQMEECGHHMSTIRLDLDSFILRVRKTASLSAEEQHALDNTLQICARKKWTVLSWSEFQQRQSKPARPLLPPPPPETPSSSIPLAALQLTPRTPSSILGMVASFFFRDSGGGGGGAESQGSSSSEANNVDGSAGAIFGLPRKRKRDKDDQAVGTNK
jgi:hypothetical protein